MRYGARDTQSDRFFAQTPFCAETRAGSFVLHELVEVQAVVNDPPAVAWDHTAQRAFSICKLCLTRKEEPGWNVGRLKQPLRISAFWPETKMGHDWYAGKPGGKRWSAMMIMLVHVDQVDVLAANDPGEPQG
jgi:hypothetical protein